MTATQIQLSSDYGGSPVIDPTTGDRFRVRLGSPLVFNPPEAYGVACISAAAWYTSPNISAANGNNIFRYTSATVAPIGTFTITIPDGLYSTEDLTTEIARATTQIGHGSLAVPLFVFNPLVSTQQVSITVDQASTIGLGFSIDNTVANAMPVSILGFPVAVEGPTVASPTTFNPVALADMGYGIAEYLINVDIISASIATNGENSSAIVRLPLNVTPNSQITYQSTLSGIYLPLNKARIDSISAWITDGNGRPISLNNNPFSVTLAIVKLPRDTVSAAALVN